MAVSETLPSASRVARPAPAPSGLDDAARPGQPSRLVALDGVRGIAALMVLFYHTWGAPVGGKFGVDLFFALSGFLISGQLLAENRRTGAVRLGRFYGRRLFRLLPPFLLLYGLYRLLRALTPELPPLSPLQLPALLLATNLEIHAGTFKFNYIAHLWTLSIEWQFYLIWPAILVLLARLNLAERWIGALAALLVGAVWFARLQGFPVIRFDGLLLGSVMAVATRQDAVRRLVASRAGGIVMGVALAGFALIAIKVRLSSAWFYPNGLDAVAVLAAIIVLCVALGRSPPLDRLLSSRPMVHIGRISYGLYLYHYPIASIMFVHLYSGKQKLIVGLFVALPLADCSWRYVERPLIDLGRRLFADRATRG